MPTSAKARKTFYHGWTNLAVVVVFLAVASWYAHLPLREVAIRAIPFSNTIGEASQ